MRYEYPTNGIQSKVFSTITDTNDNGVGDSSDEVLTESWTDGAGRVRQARTPHTFNTNGATATWAGTITEYDILGRVSRQSVPTEVDSSWNAAGDDASRGFLWTYQKYDWKGRVIRKINTDGDPNASDNDSDIFISYQGCGCAGGQVTTIESERVPDSYAGSGTLRKKRTVEEDILGRVKLDYTWYLNDVYASTELKYNGRDQIVEKIEYSGGAESNNPHQNYTWSFDGHGRLVSQHRPEQRDSSNNLKYTTYAYNADDSISSITDARNAVTHYSYNSLGLVEEMSWSVPENSQIAVPTTVEFEFDNLGNRTHLTDGLGSVTYEYDSLSRMTAETRQFNDTLSAAPLSNNRFKLEYTYGIGGQLSSYKDPYGFQVSYTQDRVGRFKTVNGTLNNTTTQYVSNPGYRSWGALKHLENVNGVEMNTTYNNRLQPATYDLSKSTTEIIQKNYNYLSDGSLSYIEDETNPIFDRLMKYDHQGRVIAGKSGAEARGETVSTNQDTELPYRQSYAFDAFDHLTQRNNLHWGITNWYNQTNNFSLNWSNNRVTNQYWVYDNDGRALTAITGSEGETAVFDARGSLKQVNSNGWVKADIYYTGDGYEAKRETYNWSNDPYPNGTWGSPTTTYYIRSSVLSGEVISQTYETGAKQNTYVLAGGSKIASHFQWTVSGTTYNNVNFNYSDPSGMTSRTVTQNGYIWDSGGGFDGAPAEADLMGGNVGISTPYVEPIEPPEPTEEFPYFEVGNYEWGTVNGQRVTYNVDGLWVMFPIGLAMHNSPVVQCPDNDCNPRRAVNHEGRNHVTSPFQARNDSRSGFAIPDTSTSVSWIDDEGRHTETAIDRWRFIYIDPDDFSNVEILYPEMNGQTRPRGPSPERDPVPDHATRISQTHLEPSNPQRDYIKCILGLLAREIGTAALDTVQIVVGKELIALGVLGSFLSIYFAPKLVFEGALHLVGAGSMFGLSAELSGGALIVNGATSLLQQKQRVNDGIKRCNDSFPNVKHLTPVS
jgi:YD repeat-containing protein